jgi:hypothetical protein
MFIPTYIVSHYVNGILTHTLRNLSKRNAYTMAIPLEALEAFAKGDISRWHILNYISVSEKINNLLVGETTRVCWQDSSPDLDTEHVLIGRDNDVWKNNVVFYKKVVKM